jgi:hypothetical protein
MLLHPISVLLPHLEAAAQADSHNWAASLDHPDQEYDDCQHEQKVDESAQRVGTHHPEGPQNQENYRDCPKHVDCLPLRATSTRREKPVSPTPTVGASKVRSKSSETLKKAGFALHLL